MALIPTIGALRVRLPKDPSNGGIAEGEDPAVGGDEPVALAIGGGADPDDRRIEA